MGIATKIASWLLFVICCSQSVAGEIGAHPSGIRSLKVSPRGGDFTLESSRGPVSTVEFRGKVIMLYFGYTRCPDVCPTSFSVMAQTLNELDKKELERVVGLFVSVDPERDTVDRLAEYVSYFHPNFIGLTGTQSAVADAAGAYGVQYGFTDASDSAMGYIVNHSAAIYLIDRQGKLRFAFPHETPPETLLGAIRMLLEGDQ
jgi:protein SCO1/2